MKVIIITPDYQPLTNKGYEKIGKNLVNMFGENNVDILSINSFNKINKLHRTNKGKEIFSDFNINFLNFIKNLFYSLIFFKPLQISLYNSKVINKKVTAILNESNYDIIFFNTIRVSDYFDSCKNSRSKKILLLIDDPIISALNTSSLSRSIFYKSIYFLEFLLLKMSFMNIIKNFDSIGFVSELERKAYLNSYNTFIIPYGIEFANYHRRTYNHSSSTIVFSGNLGYINNINGIIYFINNIYPIVKSYCSNVSLLLVGSNPHKSIIRLIKKDKSILMFSDVKNINQFISSAAVAISPIKSISGIQTKIIEAMALNIPVVSTDNAAFGLGAQNGVHLLHSNCDNKFAFYLSNILNDINYAKFLSKNAFEFVYNNFNLDKNNDVFNIYLKNLTNE